MGVPAFFKWLSTKYPSIVSHCAEKRGSILDDKGTRAYVDTTEPNPNGEEFDNLYLDMNGIIHPCTHPENKPAPKSEGEMFVAIFEYIDRLFAIIRPRRVLYMAIDGVAPRAKMNQQRSRRFRAAKEAREKHLTIEKLRAELIAKGAHLPESDSEHFDSNCITPGTPFMARLAVALRGYIYDRLTNDPGWKDLLVFLSDANVPGEGEHKIMDFIRRQRNAPTHDSNTRHCLCGADADLIMLGLATHEPHFTIIREEFKPNQPKPCELCGQYGHEMQDCVGAPREEISADQPPPPIPTGDADFIFIRLYVLRQYLESDLKLNGITFDWDFERVLDDWVFMCFFVGNDFLPHLPSLEIREGAIDRLIEIYKSTVTKTGGWLTDSGKVHLDRVQLIMTDLGQMEDEIFKNRRESELQFRNRKKNNNFPTSCGTTPQRPGQKPHFENPPATGYMEPVALGGRYGMSHPFGRYSGPQVSAKDVHDVRRDCQRPVNWVDRNLNNLEAATALKAMLKRKPVYDDNLAKIQRQGSGRRGSLGGVGASVVLQGQETNKNFDIDDAMDAADEVRFWEDGWRCRYYKSKFGVDPEDAPDFCITVGQEYARGLCWVLAYYYQGCASWDWYFPYHYAPFASNFSHIADLDPGFDKKPTRPFCPLEQLMSVFPADSRSHVPQVWQDLMTDPESPIIDFYPTNFKIDLNGKRFLWMGVALLPFVDEVRLLAELDKRRHLLSAEEQQRNIRGPDRLFCHGDHPAGTFLLSLYDKLGVKDRAASNDQLDGTSIPPEFASVIDPRLTHGVSGRIWVDELAYLPGETVPSVVPSLVPNVRASKALGICFADPAYPTGFAFPARLLDGVKLPAPMQLQPPQRGRGRGRSRTSNSPRFSRNYDSERFTSADNTSCPNQRQFNNPVMGRMIRHSLSTNEQRVTHSYDARLTSDSPHCSRSRSFSQHQHQHHYRPSHQPGAHHTSYLNPYSTHPPHYSTGLSDNWFTTSHGYPPKNAHWSRGHCRRS